MRRRCLRFNGLLAVGPSRFGLMEKLYILFGFATLAIE